MTNSLKILHINTCNFGSTGNIMLNISNAAEECGYYSWVAYADSRTNRKKNIDNSLIIGNILERNLHLKLAYYTGFNGCFSILGTKRFLRKVDRIKPDIIHLHNLHNCYINLKMLFDYIKERDITVVWTLHDCWAFTGQCPHFSMIGCEKWKTGCFDCPQYKEYPASIIDQTKRMYVLKKEWFTGVKNLTIVTPSQWLAGRVKESFLGCYPTKVINNGIDLKIYKPTQSNFRERNKMHNNIILLGVASEWSKSKGIDTFIELSKKMPENYKVVLVGLTDELIKSLPSNILKLPRTNNPKELAEIYSAADFFINPSLEETMGLVTVEALACGTPAVVSNSTAVPEMIGPECGVVVSKNNTNDFIETIKGLNIEFIQDDCLAWAKKFDMKIKFDEYINVYKSVLV
jgi:putative colanic acid biosynthesis glycosyltransferase